MPELISGEFQAKNIQKKFEPELPKVIAEGAVEVESPKIAEASKEAETIDVDEIMAELPGLDDEISKAHNQIRSYQEFAIKYANKPDILAKLNEESKQLQTRYDKLRSRRDELESKLRQVSKAA